MGSSTIGSSEVLVLLPDFLNLFHRNSYQKWLSQQLKVLSFMPLQGEKKKEKECVLLKNNSWE
jgi:hypothetical protein